MILRCHSQTWNSLLVTKIPPPHSPLPSKLLSKDGKQHISDALSSRGVMAMCIAVLGRSLSPCPGPAGKSDKTHVMSASSMGVGSGGEIVMYYCPSWDLHCPLPPSLELVINPILPWDRSCVRSFHLSPQLWGIQRTRSFFPPLY